MGTYSYSLYSCLTIRNDKVREEFKKWLEKKSEWKEVIDYDDGYDDVDINIDGWKIIGYWYVDFLDDLVDLARFLEGYFVLESEEKGVFAKICFENGNVKIVLFDVDFDGESADVSKVDLTTLLIEGFENKILLERV